MFTDIQYTNSKQLSIQSYYISKITHVLFLHSQQAGIEMFFLRAQYNLVHITVINICLETTAYAIELPLPHQGVQRIQI